MRTHHHHHRPGMWPGLILACVGGGLLARELGLLPSTVRLVDFWPLLLVFAGLSSMLRARGPWAALPGLGLSALGGLLLGGTLGFVPFGATRFWPLLLVLLGLASVMRARRSEGRETSKDPPADLGHALRHDLLMSADDRISKQVTFAGLEFKVESRAWKGGEIGVTAGGVELDLRHAQLAPEGAVLDVRIVMGGIDVRVPDTWQVQCDVTPLLGGADDSTRTTQGLANTPVLRVIGTVTLGGLSIHH